MDDNISNTYPFLCAYYAPIFSSYFILIILFNIHNHHISICYLSSMEEEKSTLKKVSNVSKINVFLYYFDFIITFWKPCINQIYLLSFIIPVVRYVEAFDNYL